jgi:hypothetical protein
MSHERVMDLLCDVSLLCRIAPDRAAGLSSTGFSLFTVDSPQFKPHRLKPVLLHRARLTLCPHAMERANGYN